MRLGRASSVAAVKPAQEKTYHAAESDRAKYEWASDGYCEPGDYDQTQGHDGARFCAGDWNAAEAHSLWCYSLAASQVLEH
jgi:hypothetical protein